MIGKCKAFHNINLVHILKVWKNNFPEKMAILFIHILILVYGERCFFILYSIVAAD